MSFAAKSTIEVVFVPTTTKKGKRLTLVQLGVVVVPALKINVNP